jgi:glycosyltransferase involved in cell wall biosynthesis
MKILHLAESAKGGIGTYISQVLPCQLAAFGRNAIRVVVPAEHVGQIAGVDAACIEPFARPSRSAGSLAAFARATAAAVREFQPDIIHAHSTFAGGVARGMYGWRRRRPALVYCPHGWAFNMQRAAWKQLLVTGAERALAPMAARIVAISDYEAAEARRIGITPTKLRVIRNGISSVAPAPADVCWPDERRKILFVGRLDKQKGFDLLMAALRGLEDKLVVRVAGEAVVDGCRVSPAANVAFLGWLSPVEIEGHLRCADLLVMPSRWEGFGLAALEAMRAAKPVIAAAVGGLPEVVVDGVTGRLVPAEDVGALRSALLADDAQALRAMGERGRRRFMAEFTAERMNDEIMALYDELVRRPSV